MGFTLFLYTWYNILMLVKMRLDQMVSKKVKKVRFYLKTACGTYFAIWFGYPTLWVLYEAGVIDPVTSHLMHVLFDVIAKSVYGFALLFFVVGGEKHDFVFLPLRPTVEMEEHSDDEEGEKGHEGTTIIGSKLAKKKLRASVSNTAQHYDDYNFNTPSDTNYMQGSNFPTGMAAGINDNEISVTTSEIMNLNKQLENIMAKQKNLEEGSQ